MTSAEAMFLLYQAMIYILQNNTPGDFVECGVWKGGGALLVAKMPAEKNITGRKSFLYDTFEGMSEPSKNNKDYTGKHAGWFLENSSIKVPDSVWCYSSFVEVKCTLLQPGLATDWYESARREMIHLYRLLSLCGVLIIDDYGHWEGCRKAVDEYFQANHLSLLLNRIDNTGRRAIKTSLL